MSDTNSPDPVPPDQPVPLGRAINDQLVPVLVESFSGMFDIVFNVRNLYGNGKVNVKLLVTSLLKLIISLSVLLVIFILIIALHSLKNNIPFLPALITNITHYFPASTPFVNQLLPIIVDL